MADIRHRIGVHAPVDDVYAAVATPEGLKTWWTNDVTGESRVGEELGFWFGGPDRGAAAEVVELVPDQRVVWRVVRGPDDWVGTTITFDIHPGDGETIVMFWHAGWAEPVEFMHHCSTAWGYFLLSLKHALEDPSRATPWPHNELVSSWG
jgi:uncharacterized protein YndB with AHSA1/START domain